MGMMVGMLPSLRPHCGHGQCARAIAMSSIVAEYGVSWRTRPNEQPRCHSWPRRQSMVRSLLICSFILGSGLVRAAAEDSAPPRSPETEVWGAETLGQIHSAFYLPERR